MNGIRHRNPAARTRNTADEDLVICFRDVLVNMVICKTRETFVTAAVDNLGLIRFGGREDDVGDLLEAHRYTPTRTFRKRAGAAPCPVPITCMGSPLPQFGVPQTFQLFSLPIASQEFQNSGVMPAYVQFRRRRVFFPFLIS